MAIDWTKSMQQIFEYFTVDPVTWKDRTPLRFVKSSTINRDSSADTLGSADMEMDENIGECYVRIYLVAKQFSNILNRTEIERIALGTYLIQTVPGGFDGRKTTTKVEAYTALMELKENPVPIGYFISKDDNIVDTAYKLLDNNCRAIIVKGSSDKKIYDDYIADTSDTWLTYIKDFLANAQYHLDIDGYGRVLMVPDQEMSSLQPVYTFNDDNSSILKPDITWDYDLYGIPNVVEVIYSKDGDYLYSKVTNDNPNSITSTINRGRIITHRVVDPDLSGSPDQKQIDEYASKLLESLSSIQYSVTYTHGYCPVRVGDCVRLNYTRAGLKNIKAKVVSQSIACSSGCLVTETAVYSKNVWKETI